MPSQSFRIGVASVSIPVNDSTSVPSLGSLVFTASAVSPTVLEINDVNQALPTSTNMQVILGLVGRDETNGGYTVAQCSPGSGIVSLTSEQVIEVKVPVGNWPANTNKATALAVFLKIGASDFYLADFAYLDLDTDFSFTIKAKPLAGASAFTSTLLQSTTSDDTLGDRLPKGITYRNLSPTTGGVTVNREVTSVSVDPDTGNAFGIASTRTASITFQLLANDIRDVVSGNAGVYAQYTSGGYTYKQSKMSLNTAAALVTGNKPLKLVLPPDNNGTQEIRLYLGQLVQNQSANTEAWTKTATTPITYTFSPASIDKLINNQHVEIAYSKK